MDKYKVRYETLRALSMMSPEDAKRVLSKTNEADVNPSFEAFDKRVDELTKTLVQFGINIKDTPYLRFKERDGARFSN